MHRIDGPGATNDNQFTEGDPGTGVLPTQVTDDWANAVQEELANVIEAAGIALSKPDNTQLYTAIAALIGASAFTTGDVKLTLKTAAPAGWVLCNDGSIGNASSGATTRANADCQALFTLLWTNVADSYAQVQDSAGTPVGRGASASADWAANRRINLTKMLGRALAVAGAGSGLTARALGLSIGAETHVLAVGEIPAHTHTYDQPGVDATAAPAAGTAFAQARSAGAASGSAGGGAAHNNMQPSAFLNVLLKL